MISKLLIGKIDKFENSFENFEIKLNDIKKR